MYCVDAQKLHEYLAGNKFARIEVSNISDNWVLGAARTVASLGDLLQPTVINPYATLLTLFLNAVPEETTEKEEMKSFPTDFAMVMQYLPMEVKPQSHYDPEALMRSTAKDLVRDNDKYFDRYMRRYKFRDIEELTGISMKERHTIIEKWPLRLKKKPHQRGAQEEFKLLLASAHTGVERYVEWKRTA